jgi:hypothetical protein
MARKLHQSTRLNPNAPIISVGSGGSQHSGRQSVGSQYRPLQPNHVGPSTFRAMTQLSSPVLLARTNQRGGSGSAAVGSPRITVLARSCAVTLL